MQVIRERTVFKVRDGITEHTVFNYNKSKFLRGLNEEQLQKFEQAENRYKAIKLSDGQYQVTEDGGLKGGGPGWAIATALIGYTTVGVAALGTLIATLPSGPGCVVAAAAVATGGVHLVTEAVIAVAVIPTP